ncbi:MAG: trypsin-like peptidase domain-containing protein [Bosea sp. (in: a-proteobacteria)]
MTHSQRLRRAFLGACALVPLFLGAPSLAQTPAAPPAAPALDPAIAASKSAFERLEEAERKAIQNELIWTGDFNGVAGGEFGKRTYDAMLAFERRTKSPAADGILNPAERSALQRDAKAARDGQRWTQVRDEKTGVSLGLPMAVLTQKVAVEIGQVYRSADGAVSVEMAAMRNADPGALQTLFDQLRADKPGRKVTYRLLRPDWFVVSGEEGPRRFYTRIASGPAGLRGYTFRFPAAEAARYERLMIAMANSFEPFPGTGVAANPANVPAVVPVATTAAPAVRPVTPTVTRNLITAVRIAPGKLATSASGFAACKEAKLGNEPIAASAVTREGDLVLIAAGAGTGTVAAAALPAEATTAARKVYAISFDQSDGTPRPVLTAGTLAAAGSGTPARMQAALQSGAAGAPVFNEDGALVGLVSGAPIALKPVAGVTPVASYPMVAMPLSVAQPAPAQQLATRAQAVVAIVCAS